MPDFTRLQRSRLRLAIYGSIGLVIIALFPLVMIVWAGRTGDFHVSYPWIFFGTIIGEIGLILGYYIKKESDRPSFVNNTVSNIGFPADAKEKKIMDVEDESDPETMPL